MKVCSNCNAVLDDNVRFCTKCGQLLSEEQRSSEDMKTMFASETPQGFADVQGDDNKTMFASEAQAEQRFADAWGNNSGAIPADNAPEFLTQGESAVPEQQNANPDTFDNRTVMADDVPMGFGYEAGNNSGTVPLDEFPAFGNDYAPFGEASPVQETNTQFNAQPADGIQEPAKKKSLIPLIIAIAAVVVIGLGVGAFFIIKNLTKTPYQKVDSAMNKTNQEDSATIDANASVAGIDVLTEKIKTDGDKIMEIITGTDGKVYVTAYETVDDNVYISQYVDGEADTLKSYVIPKENFEEQYTERNMGTLSDIIYQTADLVTMGKMSENLKKQGIEAEFKQALDESLGTDDMESYATIEEKDNGEYVMNVSLGELVGTILKNTGEDKDSTLTEILKGAGSMFDMHFILDGGMVKTIDVETNTLYPIKYSIDISELGVTKVDIPQAAKDAYSAAKEISDLSELGW